jgi:hypothetical protein
MLRSCLSSLRLSQEHSKRSRLQGAMRWVRGAPMQTSLMHLMFLAILLVPVAGQADESSEAASNMNGTMPRCGPQLDGRVFCESGTIYECELVGPNSMERRTGWRWKADVLRGCAEPTPAAIDQQDSLPPDITYAPQQSSPSGARGSQGRMMFNHPDSSLRPSNGRRRD